jgi:hypothetical protein
MYCQHGFAGLAHSRADKGFPKLYSKPEFESVIVAAGRLRRNPRGKVRREFTALGLPGIYDTFRRWIRKLQVYGFVETSPASERGQIRA